MLDRFIVDIARGVRVGGDGPLLLIAGPCVIEGRDAALRLAEKLASMARAAGWGFVFKASYDKANRSSAQRFRGPGIDEGLRILEEIGRDVGVPLLSDVHDVAQVGAAAAVLDCLQIPAFLCRQTDLLVAAARTGKVVNVKKGQFMAPDDMPNVVAKIAAATAATAVNAAPRVLLTERGTTFGYHNLVVDFRGLPVMRRTGCPIVFDATHAVQLPGARGDASGGEAEFIPVLARAAVAVGVDGVFLEVHEDPARALSDGANALAIERVPALLAELLRVDAAARGSPRGP